MPDGDRPGGLPAASAPATAEPTERLFVALWPPRDVIGAIGALDRPDVRGVRWTTPDQWHVTLAFLGDVAGSSLPALERALASAAGAAGGPPEAVLGPRTVRYGRGVLGVPVAGADQLAAAVRRCVRDAVASGSPGPARPFDGHLTLARGRGGRAVPTGITGAPLSARWSVDEVCLVRSQLHPDGARYETLRRATVPS